MDPLTKIGMHHGTDKVSHGFCGFYHRHLAQIRDTVTKVLEIGIAGGASLQMWRDFFPNAEIHGFDNHAPHGSTPSRIHLHEGDQADRRSLNRLIEQIGSRFDLIIDDGGHTMEQQHVSLAFLFPHLKPGGQYILEDLHTSFFPTIRLFRDGKVSGSYSTGIEDCHCTAYQLVEALLHCQTFHSDYMSVPEMDYLSGNINGGEIFDRDGDHLHITSVIHKSASTDPSP